MATDYYATFSSIHSDLNLLIPALESCLFEGAPQIDYTVDRLCQIDQHFEYTHDTRKFKNFSEAILGTSDWDGVEIHFLRERQMCSLLLWRDTAGLLTITFCEPGRLFETQIQDYGLRLRLGVFLRRIMDKINSNFCILEAESSFTTRTREDIISWVQSLRTTKPQADWRLVICDNDFLPGSGIPADIRKMGFFHYTPGSKRWFFSFMGEIDFVV